MSQYVPILTNDSYTSLRRIWNAMTLEESTSVAGPGKFRQDTLDLAERLALEIPAFEWTIEVDILGRHRITIRFKGATIDVGTA